MSKTVALTLEEDEILVLIIELSVLIDRLKREGFDFEKTRITRAEEIKSKLEKAYKE